MGAAIVTVALPVLDGGPLLGEVLAAVSEQEVDRPVELLGDRLRLDRRLARARPPPRRPRGRDPRAEFSHGRTRNRLMELAERRSRRVPHAGLRPAGPVARRAARRLRAGADDVALRLRPVPAASRRQPDGPARAAEYFAPFGGARVDRGAGGAGPRRSSAARTAPSRAGPGSASRSGTSPYAEDQQLARDMLAAGLAKAYVPDAAVVHSHDHPPLRALGRYFDDFRALAEVTAPRAADAAVHRGAGAQRRRRRPRVHAPRRPRGADAALAAAPLARALGRSLGRTPIGCRHGRGGPSHWSAGALRARVSRPVLFVTNHAPPFRVGAFKALHEREDVVFALIGGDVRHGGGGTRSRRAAVPRHPAARSAASLRLAASGRFRAVVAGLSGRVALPAAYAGRAPGRRPVRAVGDDLGAPAHARARALLPAAAPHLPPRRRDRHLRPARLGLRARQGARRGPVVRGAAERRRRVLGGAARARPPRRLPGPVCRPAGAGEGLRGAPSGLASSGLSAPSAALVLVGDGPLRARAVATGAVVLAGPQPRRRCATSTPAATLWSYRRSPRATSSSRGGSSSTKPSTRESP